MAGIDFTFKKLQSSFFDAKKITSAAQKAKYKALARFGAYARTTMRNSIKYKPADQHAAAGAPPFAHRYAKFTKEKKDRKTGAVTRQTVSPLKELMFFAIDATRDTTVIGPVVFGTHGARALEHGGTVTGRDPKTGAARTRTIAPHPFAKPAGDATADKLSDLLKNSIH